MSRSTLNTTLKSTMTAAQRQAHDAAVDNALAAPAGVATPVATLVATPIDFPKVPASRTDADVPHVESADANLTPPQRLAVAALAGGQTFDAAAGAAGVSRRTLFKWRQDAAFMKAVEELSHETMITVSIRLRNLMLRATRVASDSLLSSERGPSLAIRVLNCGQIWKTAKEGIVNHEAAEEPSADSASG